MTTAKRRMRWGTRLRVAWAALRGCSLIVGMEIAAWNGPRPWDQQDHDGWVGYNSKSPDLVVRDCFLAQPVFASARVDKIQPEALPYVWHVPAAGESP